MFFVRLKLVWIKLRNIYIIHGMRKTNGKMTYKCFLAVFLLLSFCTVLFSAERQAVVYYSDGTVLEGMLIQGEGKDLKLSIPDGGDIYTFDMVSLEKVQYDKVRKFGIDVLKKITFFPTKEELLRKWKFVEQTKYNEETAEADYTPAQKEYYGELYPVRQVAASVEFNSGEVLYGHLYSTSVLLKSEAGNKKIVLRSKDSGREGQGLDDLVYVSCINFVDEGVKISAVKKIKLPDAVIESVDEVFAITKDTLNPVKATLNEFDHSVTVESTLGEDVFLAVKKSDGYFVGWPCICYKYYKAMADEYVSNARDFFNDRELISVWPDNDNNYLYGLVSLRRRHADSNFGEIGGEWDKSRNGIVEPWRLSIWRWRIDSKSSELALTGRGTFVRLIFEPAELTPFVGIEGKLWTIPEK